MHGKLYDLNSVEGQLWRSNLEETADRYHRRHKKKCSVDEFKLNVSGWWTKEDVWGTSGWEMNSNIAGTISGYGKSTLTWKKYESSESGYSIFLQHLSLITWPEQNRFKEVFDRYLKVASKKISVQSSEGNCRLAEHSSSASPEANRKACFPQSIGLKQLGRSIKYMTLAEKREQQKKKGKDNVHFQVICRNWGP